MGGNKRINNKGAVQVEAAIYYPIVLIFAGILFLLAILKCGNAWKTYYAKEEELTRWELEMGENAGYRWLDDDDIMRLNVMSGWSTTPNSYPVFGEHEYRTLHDRQNVPFLNEWESERYQDIHQYFSDYYGLVTQEEYVNYSATLYSLRRIREEAREDD